MHIDGWGGGCQDDDKSRDMKTSKVSAELSSGESKRAKLCFTCEHTADKTCKSCIPRGTNGDRMNRWSNKGGGGGGCRGGAASFSLALCAWGIVQVAALSSWAESSATCARSDEQNLGEDVDAFKIPTPSHSRRKTPHREGGTAPLGVTDSNCTESYGCRGAEGQLHFYVSIT